jgi:hypothetical protein
MTPGIDEPAVSKPWETSPGLRREAYGLARASHPLFG